MITDLGGISRSRDAESKQLYDVYGTVKNIIGKRIKLQQVESKTWLKVFHFNSHMSNLIMCKPK